MNTLQYKLNMMKYQTLHHCPLQPYTSHNEKKTKIPFTQPHDLHQKPKLTNSLNIQNSIKDKRRKIDSHFWPYCCIGIVQRQIFKTEDKIYGTGTLIGPYHVLTCAHVVYKNLSESEQDHISFIISPEGEGSEGKYRVDKVLISPKYKEKPECLEDYRHDWAILVLDLEGQNLDRLGYVGMKPNFKKIVGQHQNNEIQINGYPREKMIFDQNLPYLYGIQGDFHFEGNHLIRYNLLQTSLGQSGSPVFLAEGKSIIGIHVLENHAVYLTIDIMVEAHKMLKEQTKYELLPGLK